MTPLHTIRQSGCDNLIVPVAGWETEEKMEDVITMLNCAQEKLAAAGIRLGYHNHSREFMLTPYGKIAENEILARTKVELEVDTFWAFNAGVDPVEFLEAHKNRIRVIHLKDGIPCARSAELLTACRMMCRGKRSAREKLRLHRFTIGQSGTAC